MRRTWYPMSDATYRKFMGQGFRLQCPGTAWLPVRGHGCSHEKPATEYRIVNREDGELSYEITIEFRCEKGHEWRQTISRRHGY